MTKADLIKAIADAPDTMPVVMFEGESEIYVPCRVVIQTLYSVEYNNRGDRNLQDADRIARYGNHTTRYGNRFITIV